MTLFGTVPLPAPAITLAANASRASPGAPITAVAPAQVIILEDEEPPDDLKESIAFPGFTKNRSIGRYGLFPRVTD